MKVEGFGAIIWEGVMGGFVKCGISGICGFI
jgi:hypothetical protein